MRELKRDLPEKEFEQWKEEWMREKGCPFFACSQAFVRKVCGGSYLCGVLYTYEMYKQNKWVKVCDINLAEDIKNVLPTKTCPACTGSMCIKIDSETNTPVGQSWCKLMNDYYQRNKIKVKRHLEKYIFSWGTYLIPLVGETAYLELAKNPEALNKFLKEKKK